MKQLQEVIEGALSLINDGEEYIIFNDGKAVKTNLQEGIEIKVNEYFDGNDYYKRKQTVIEEEINNEAKFVTSIMINRNSNLKIIHINDDVNYLDYNIRINNHVNTKITNLYYKIVNRVKIKFDILCKDHSQTQIKSFMNCYDQITTIVNAYCLNNAYIKMDELSLNDNQAEAFTNIYLIDEHSLASLTSVAVNTCGLKQTYTSNVFHIGQDTKSRMNNFGIAKNNSNLIFNSDGVILKNAKNSDLAQKTKGIILDLHSSISANPFLEIDENEVMANHGASIGAIDEEDLYYLMSRGLTQEVSELLIVNAFINPYFRDIDDEKLSNYIQTEINKHL
jgi:Fe-S cluster assembly protein SufD